MKPDGMIVEPEYIGEALKQTLELGPEKALEQLAEQEPILAALVQEKLAAVVGKLTLNGAPHPTVFGVYHDTLLLVLGSIQALRRGHYELWKDATLAEEAPVPTPAGVAKDPRKPRRSRRARPQADGEEVPPG
jgi:hypothetical protein